VTQQKRWYEYDKDELHTGVAAEVKRIKDQQSEQRKDIVHFMSLYAAGNVAGLGNLIPRDRILEYVYQVSAGSTRFNMAAAIVDTAESMTAQAPAVPIYMTSGGDFGLVRKAKKKTQVLQGQCQEVADEPQREAWRDALKTGTGICRRFVNDDGLTALRRVHPIEFLIEHADGLYCQPRSAHETRIIAKEVLKDEFPEHADAIDACPAPTEDAATSYFLDRTSSNLCDVVEVVESHHFGTGKKAGLWCITIQGATLKHKKLKAKSLDEVYSVVRYKKRDFGFFGMGLVESCREAQTRVNDLIARVARGQDLGSNLIVANPYMPGSAPVPPSKLTNEMGLIINYDVQAGPPTVVKWDGTQWDLQEQINLEFERALLVEGLSQEQTNGEGAGDGLTSGVAVRAADDVQTRRLVSPIKRFQQFCISNAKLIELGNDELAEENPEFEVRGRMQQGRQTFLLTSKWKELTIAKGNAQIEMMPMSALPTTPQGKWAAVMEWIDAGFVSQQYAMQLLQFPDLDSYADTELAHIDIAQWQVEQILDGVRVLPVPRQNLQTAIDIGTKSELKAMTMGAPANVIDAFELFLKQCEAMLEKAALAAEAKARQQQAASQPMPQPGAPVPGPVPGAAVAVRGPAAPPPLVQRPPTRPTMAQVA
jgi:predicted peroxiredoxin